MWGFAFQEFVNELHRFFSKTMWLLLWSVMSFRTQEHHSTSQLCNFSLEIWFLWKNSLPCKRKEWIFSGLLISTEKGRVKFRTCFAPLFKHFVLKKLTLFVIPETIIQICSENDCDNGRALQFSKKKKKYSVVADFLEILQYFYRKNPCIICEHLSLQ